jgi:hypothetical protein
MSMANCTSKNFSTSSEFVLNARVQIPARCGRSAAFIFFFHLYFFGTILRGIKTVFIEFQNMVEESLYPLLYNPLRLTFSRRDSLRWGSDVFQLLRFL